MFPLPILSFFSECRVADGEQVTITAAHHESMNRVSEGRHERCRKSWKGDVVIHPFSCMVATSNSDIDGVIAEHARLRRVYDNRRESKRQQGAIEASKQAVASRLITPIAFYEKPPVLGEIAQYECAYYKLEPKAFLQEKIEREGGRWSIVIEVHAVAGDPDLIVSSSTKYPSDKDYTWRSMGEGSDRITITPNDPNYPGDGQGRWQPLYIAVPSVGASACRFNLYASVSKWSDTEAEKRRMQVAVNMQVLVSSEQLSPPLLLLTSPSVCRHERRACQHRAPRKSQQRPIISRVFDRLCSAKRRDVVLDGQGEQRRGEEGHVCSHGKGTDA
jgi:hypothetical protein